MASPWKFNFTAIPTAVLFSIVALPATITAFAIAYTSGDPFWSVLWMTGVLPAIWLAVVALSIRDALKRRPWRQILGAVLLLTPTVLLFNLMLTPRFALHQLFTLRPLVLQPRPTSGIAYIEKFSVCTKEVTCTSLSAVTETRSFKLKKLPDGCCSLVLINSREHKAQIVRIILNGEEINFRSDGPLQTASVRLSSENKLTVQLTGTADAYVYIVISYIGKKNLT